MNILGSLCSGVFSQLISGYPTSVFELNSRSDLISYYRFYTTDVNGVNVANYRTGSPVYDSSLVLTEAVVNTDSIFSNGSLYSPPGTQSYFRTGPFVQTSTTGLTMTGWFKLSTSSYNGGSGNGVYATILKYISSPNLTNSIITFNSIQMQTNIPGQVTLLYSIFSGSNYYLTLISSGGGYIDNNWYFFSIIFTPTQVTYSITPYSTGNAAYSSTNTLTTSLNLLKYDSAGNYQQNLTTTFSALGLTTMMPGASTRYGLYGTSLVENYYVNGGIADMRVYNSALTSANIFDLYNYVKNGTLVYDVSILYTTPTSIAVSFSSYSDADYYTVIVTPASGGASTVTKGTSSPIITLGLQSGTNYNVTMTSTKFGVTSNTSTSITATTLIPFITSATTIMYYPFATSDVSGVNVANYATGSPVYDSSLALTESVVSTDTIFANGSLYSPPGSQSYFATGPWTQTSTTGLSLTGWFKLSSSSYNGGAGIGVYGVIFKYTSAANPYATNSGQTAALNQQLIMQTGGGGVLYLNYWFPFGGYYYRPYIPFSSSNYIDNNWYFYNIIFTPTQLTINIIPYSSGVSAITVTVTLNTSLLIFKHNSNGSELSNSTTTFSNLGVTNIMPFACTRYGWIGSVVNENYYLNGNFGDTRVFNGALTTPDVTYLYNLIKNSNVVTLSLLSTTTNSIRVAFTSSVIADYYTITATPLTGGTPTTVTSTLLPATITGLTIGTKYKINISYTLYSVTTPQSSNLTVSTVTPYVVDASLSLFYPFDISSNNYTPNYATGFQVYDASFNNGATMSTSQFITGSGSVYLPTSTSQVRLGNFTTTGTNLSISFWFYVGSYPPGVAYFALNPSTTNMLANAIQMHGYSTNVIRISIINSSDQFATFNAPSANAWHHMVWVMKGSAWTVYIDNVLQTLSYPNGGPPAPIATTYIYNNLGNSPYPYNMPGNTGYISEFRVYDLELSSAQVSTLYSYRNTVAIYNFTSPTLNNTLLNYASLNYDATLNGLSNITAAQTAVDPLALYTNTGYVTSSPFFQISNTNGFSLSTWVYFTTMNNPNCLISLGTTYYSYSSGDGIGLYVDGTGVYAQYWFGNSNSNFATTKYGISSQFLNRWNHVACTVSTTASTNTTTTWSIYINGLLMGTTTETNNVYNYYNGQNINQLNIGTNIKQTNTHSAYYNSIRVHNRVLTLSEIQTMASALLTNLQVSSSNLLGWFDAYQLYSGATSGITTWKDKSLNNSTATVSNDCSYTPSINANYPVPAVYFPSTGSSMVTNVSSGIKTTTICAVITFVANNTNAWLTPSDSTNGYAITLGHLITSAGIWNTGVGIASTGNQNILINAPTLIILTINYDTNTVTSSRNGINSMVTYYKPLSSTGLSGSGTFRYGNPSNGFSTSNAPWPNYLSELMIFNVEFTDVQKQLYEGYLAWKWGIQSFLPTTHPYYSATPALSFYTAPTSTARVIPYAPTNISWTSVTGVTKYSATVTDSAVSMYSGTYTITASSAYNGYDQGVNSMFHIYSGTAWVIAGQTAYSGGSAYYYTTTGYSTTVDVSGTVYGEWFQIDCPKAFVLYSYTMGSTGNTRMPTSWVIAGSNSPNGPWTSIPNLLNNAPGYNCKNVYTIPSAWVTEINSTGTYFTIVVNANNQSYKSYRIIFTSAYSNNNWLGVNNFYMTSYTNNTYFAAGSLSSGGSSGLNNPINYLKLDTVSTDTGSSAQTINTSGSVTYTTIGGKQCAYFSNSFSNYLYFNFANPTQLTFCYWIYCIDSGYYTAVSISSVGGWDPSLQCDINNTTVYGFIAVPNQWTVPISYANNNAGNWTHLAYTVNQSTYACQLYVNGVLRASGTGTGALGRNKNHFIIGRSGDNGRAFYGYIRQFCVYNSVLTASQIQSVYNATA